MPEKTSFNRLFINYLNIFVKKWGIVGENTYLYTQCIKRYINDEIFR